MKLNLPATDEDDEIDITPMIDCVFLLVLFFMVTSSFIDEAKMDPTSYAVTIPSDGKTYSLSVHGTYLLREGDKETEIASLAELVERSRAEPDKKDFHIDMKAVVQLATDTKPEDAHVVPLTLPTAEKPATIRRDQADVLTVPREGAIRFKDVAGERVYPEAGELMAELKRRPAEARMRPVILRADAKCSYQQVVLARNALRLGGVELIFEEVEVRHGNP